MHGVAENVDVALDGVEKPETFGPEANLVVVLTACGRSSGPVVRAGIGTLLMPLKIFGHVHDSYMRITLDRCRGNPRRELVGRAGAGAALAQDVVEVAEEALARSQERLGRGGEAFTGCFHLKLR